MLNRHQIAVALGYVTCIVIIAIWLTSPELYAVNVDSLKEPMKNLKTEVFGWLFAIKVAAAAVGGAFALAQQSLTPFGVGAGIAAGIHFFDKYIGDGSSMVLSHAVLPHGTLSLFGA